MNRKDTFWVACCMILWLFILFFLSSFQISTLSKNFEKNLLMVSVKHACVIGWIIFSYYYCTYLHLTVFIFLKKWWVCWYCTFIEFHTDIGKLENRLSFNISTIFQMNLFSTLQFAKKILNEIVKAIYETFAGLKFMLQLQGVRMHFLWNPRI